MKLSCKRLWKLLIDKKMLKKDLKQAAGLSPYVMARLGHDQPVNAQILCNICQTLDCSLEDIVEMVPDGDAR